MADGLAATLSTAGATTWLDTYRLENACSVGASVYRAASEAAFVVLLVTPRYVVSPSRCVELLAALRRPREHVFVWVDGGADWAVRARLVLTAFLPDY